MHSKKIISINCLYKKFKEQKFPAINKITNSFYKGEIIGLVGFNGSGKTTLLRLLCGSLIPDSGSIKFQNVDKDYLRLSIVPSNERSMFWRLTVIQNLEFFYDIYSSDLSNRNYKINSLLEMLDCVDIKNKLFMHISSGQKKIIMIIRSLMINPSVLLFDELTNGLDIKSKFLVYDSINKIINQNNDLVIF